MKRVSYIVIVVCLIATAMLGVSVNPASADERSAERGTPEFPFYTQVVQNIVLSDCSDEHKMAVLMPILENSLLMTASQQWEKGDKDRFLLRFSQAVISVVSSDQFSDEHKGTFVTAVLENRHMAHAIVSVLSSDQFSDEHKHRFTKAVLEKRPMNKGLRQDRYRDPEEPEGPVLGTTPSAS